MGKKVENQRVNKRIVTIRRYNGCNKLTEHAKRNVKARSRNLARIRTR